MKKIKFATLATTVAALTVSCSGGGSSESGTAGFESKSATTVTSTVGVTDDTGTSVGTFAIPAGTNKLALTATTDGIISTDYVTTDSGATLLAYDGEFVTLSTFYDLFVTAVNLPSRDFDAPLSGSNISMQTSVINTFGAGAAGVPGKTISYSMLAKSDPDLNSGTLQVNVAFVGGTASDPAVRAAMVQAEEIFRNIYGGQAGIAVNITESEFGGPAVIPDPGTGDALFGAISSALPAPAVNVCVGYDLTTSGLLGMSGGIPGAPLPTVKSCVGVSAINSAGADGVFSAEDVRVLGETLAHEIGHYVGLFHPVEGDFASFDPLTDTPQCSGEANCDAALGTNNMYYSPILAGDGTLLAQGSFTPQQRGVMNRYAAVD